ncbi:MAG: hypothetical protein O8C64_08785 [Candidatus Methanoperedens sp.]|nr:hypothetical protein [Candidatus Methanoperedens sp.]MCZ7405570.1 hypothetical protein [Candidatus Methanoperedens sp.]
MELPKIEDILKNYDRIFTFFLVGYFALYCVFGSFFLDYDLITRIILSAIVSNLLFKFYVSYSAIVFFKFWKNDTKKLLNPGDVIKIDPQTDIAVSLNIILFSSIKLLYIFGVLQFNLNTLFYMLTIIIIFQPIIGIIDGYGLYKREINKLKYDLEFAKFKNE